MATGRADSDTSRPPTATVSREKRRNCRGRPAGGRRACRKAGTHAGRTRRAGYQGSAKRRSRREAAAREGGTHVYPWGTVKRCLQRGAEMHGQDRVLFLCEKKAKLGRVSALFMGRARTISTRKHKHNLCLRPGLTERDHGQLAESTQQGTGVTGTVESGRPPSGGPVRSDRKEPRSLRSRPPGGSARRIGEPEDRLAGQLVGRRAGLSRRAGHWPEDRSPAG
jgi:hypothetical protein